jgi:hypothetical protein
MTTASITQITYNTPQTISGIAGNLSTAFTNAGFGNPINSYNTANGDFHNVFQIVGDNTVTKGTIFFDSWVTNQTSSSAQRQIFSQIFDTWNSTSGTNGSNIYVYPSSPASSLSIVNGQPIIFTSINHPELKVVSVQQLSYGQYFFGILRPKNIPDWWNQNVFPYFFMVTFHNNANNNSGQLVNFFPLASTLNPFSNGGYLSYMRNSGFLNANPVTGKRSILPGLVMVNETTLQGDAGKTSDDILIASGTLTSFLDTLPVITGTEEYTFLASNTSSALAIRTI